MKKLKVIHPQGRDIPHVGARAYGESYIIGQDITEEQAAALLQTRHFELVEDTPPVRVVKKEEKGNE